VRLLKGSDRSGYIRIACAASSYTSRKVGDGSSNGDDIGLHSGHGIGKCAHGSFLSVKMMEDCGEIIAQQLKLDGFAILWVSWGPHVTEHIPYG
jgi:hypothetical protein